MFGAEGRRKAGKQKTMENGFNFELARQRLFERRWVTSTEERPDSLFDGPKGDFVFWFSNFGVSKTSRSAVVSIPRTCCRKVMSVRAQVTHLQELSKD
jgi:hypothetical protein